MASTTAFASEKVERNGEIGVWKDQLYESIRRLSDWLERNDYRGYDTFDGLNARFVRPLTFESKFLRTVLQQGVRRFPLNLRPLLGVQKSHSTQGLWVSWPGDSCVFMHLPVSKPGEIKQNLPCSGSSIISPRDTVDRAGGTISIINREPFICRKACLPLSGPHSSAMHSLTGMTSSRRSSTCTSL